MTPRAWLVVVLGSTLLPAVPAMGQAPAPAGQPQMQVTPSSEDAREHFRRGEAAYQKGSYDIAISEWEAAYGKDPRPRIQYNLYQAFERLGRLDKAQEALQRYLSSADPDDPSYADATARMTALQQRLQATGIRIVGGVDGALVNVSGQDWGRLPRPDRIPVQPGNHRVVVKLEGYREFTSNVVVPAAQVIDVYVQLERVDGASTTPVASPTPADTAQGGSPGLPFFIASGVLGAGAVGSLVWAINRSSELSGCDAEFFCREKSAVETQRNIAFGVTAVLAVGAITTLVLGLTAGGGDEPAETALACSPGLLGAACTGRF